MVKLNDQRSESKGKYDDDDDDDATKHTILNYCLRRESHVAEGPSLLLDRLCKLESETWAGENLLQGGNS